MSTRPPVFWERSPHKTTSFLGVCFPGKAFSPGLGSCALLSDSLEPDSAHPRPGAGEGAGMT